MRAVLLLAALAAACAAQDWRPLFNGKNLDGWAVAGHGMLWYTRQKLGNGTLRVVYRMSNRKGNSGIFIRIPSGPGTEGIAVHRGIEVQIDDNDNDWHRTGVLYSMTRAKARPSKPAGRWNTMEITLQGLRTVVRLNGVLVTDYDGVSPVPPRQHDYEPERGPRPEYGYIGLQRHDDRAAIEFREVSFRPLGK